MKVIFIRLSTSAVLLYDGVKPNILKRRDELLEIYNCYKKLSDPIVESKLQLCLHIRAHIFGIVDDIFIREHELHDIVLQLMDKSVEIFKCFMTVHEREGNRITIDDDAPINILSNIKTYLYDKYYIRFACE